LIFEDKIENVRFVEVKVSDIFFEEVNANKKTAKQVSETLSKIAAEADVKGKIALLKADGELTERQTCGHKLHRNKTDLV